MTEIPITPPKHRSTAFNCPHVSCRAYAKQDWFSCFGVLIGESSQASFSNLTISRCSHCSDVSYWIAEELVYPRARTTAPPNSDMDEKIRRIYEEAADIRQHSIRGASALLRLCVQLLCIQLGETGRNINEAIGSLVKKGLPVEVQQALDVVRVVGNNAVHPGQIDVDDHEDTVEALFSLVNMIADRMITQPKKVAGLFGALPASIQKSITERDGSATP